MTREELSTVYYLKKELHMWESKLDELKNKSLAKSKKITGMPFANTGDVSDSNFQYVSQMVELQTEIKRHRCKIDMKIKEIEEYIITLDDPLLRQIIEYRCCQCKSWNQVAAMIGACTSVDAIKKYFNRKFPKNKKCPQCPK